MADVSANQRLRRLQLQASIVFFLRLMCSAGRKKNILLERWDQLMIGGLKNVHLPRMKQIAVIAYTYVAVCLSRSLQLRERNAYWP